MSSEIAIKVENFSKCYQIYRQPHDRLKQSIYPRLQRLVGKQPRQYFREFWALKDVSFEIKKGETVGVIGRNGSGKSTLLQMICGTLNPTSGGIQTNGRIAALLELGSGFNPEFTGRENVYLNAAVLGLSKEDVDSRFDEIAAFADIGDFIEQPVKTYSSGMLVRLAFSVQVHIDPDIFLVDEALAVGDHRFVQKCYKKMEEIKNSGASLFLVSHDTTAIKLLCDRAIWIHDGKISAIGVASTVVDAYRNWSDNIDKAVIKSGDFDYAYSTASLAVLRLRLLNERNEVNSSFTHGHSMKIEIPIQNRQIPENTEIRIGFSVRNNRGIEIFGSNTDVANFDLRLPVKGRAVVVTVEFDLPLLAGGRYSLSVSLDSKDAFGDYATEILMPDCAYFDVDERVKVFTLLGVDARFSISVIDQPSNN